MAVRLRTLQRMEILLQLDRQPAKTVTILAERMGASRPSISRSLNLLKKEGLVCRTQSGWHLTSTGEAEAAKAKERMSQVATQAKVTVEQIAGMWARMARPQLADIIPTRHIPDLLSSVNVASLIGQSGLASVITNQASTTLMATPWLVNNQSSAINEIIRTAAESISTLDTRAVLSKSIIPFLNIQELHTQLVRDIINTTVVTGLEEITRTNSLLLAEVVDNALAIQQAGASSLASEALGSLDLFRLSGQLSSVSQAFQELFVHEVTRIELPKGLLQPRSLAERIAVPATAVAYYTESVRDYIKAEDHANTHSLSTSDFDQTGDEKLDTLLYKLNPEFVEMRRAAWSVLRMRGPDRLRHAGTSQRELITQVLQILVPNEMLPEGSRQGPQLKARLKTALAATNSEAGYIKTMLDALVEQYAYLSKHVHTNQKHEEALVAALHMGESWIRYVLAISSRQSAKQED